ncbi:XRE family transcriptional regulator [Streptococcus uberis]|uniref:XRE family transcriptional regulator n=1 Tax=Streptococcus uberis TaxID=1349 RepID=UPI003D7888BF
MNRLEQLRQEKHLNVFEMVESIRRIAPTMTAKDWILYEKEGIKRGNDEFWQKVADWFEVDLGYLYGYSKIRNDKYVIDLQDVLHENFELKKEIDFLTDENQRLTNELYESNTILEEFRKELHIDS